MLPLCTIHTWLNEIAPYHTAEDFDNVGLLIGNLSETVDNVVFCMDITTEILTQALPLQNLLIVSHHPFIFHRISRIDTHSLQAKALRLLLENNVQVIAMHTNWDKAKEGVSDALAHAFHLQEIIPLDDYLRMGTLQKPMTPEAFVAFVEEKLEAKACFYPAGQPLIQKVAVAGGAYGEGIQRAKEMGADAFVVGEIHHHQLLEQENVTVVDAGHYATEAHGVRSLYHQFLTQMQQEKWACHAHLMLQPPYQRR